MITNVRPPFYGSQCIILKSYNIFKTTSTLTSPSLWAELVSRS